MNDLEIFSAIPADASPAQLEAYLDEACGADSDLRAKVEALISADRQDDSFMKRGSLGNGLALPSGQSPERPEEQSPDQVPNYRLLQKIGEGGFGAVFMADQLAPVKRRVALKIIKQGMDTREVIARFEAERQALAMMDHPNIAKVLDAGATESGRPFFAMELVKGIPITEFCNQQNFGLRQRLELFRDVCSAVNHAHQKGIIHRDLKPSNVMVTLAADLPVVKVIDFGIAKATQNNLTDKTLFTRFEQFLGTPAYMSPEQAALSAVDVDTRSDIYSLGVLLYELLSGVPPFDPKTLISAGYDEMRRIIAEDEPAKPSTRVTRVREGTAKAPRGATVIEADALKGDLDWIVMKTIEKDRTRRYETANAVSTDIERFLSDRPVLAAAPGMGYKFRKFARRNKTAFSVATALVALLLAGIATTTWQAVRATGEAERATLAEKLAGERLVEAETARRQEAAARAEAEDTSTFFIDMIENADPSGQGGRQTTIADALDRGVEKMNRQLESQPDRRAKLQLVIGTVYSRLGLGWEAVPLLEASYAYTKRKHGPNHKSLLPIQHSLALTYDQNGQSSKAVVMRETRYALCCRIHGAQSRHALWAMDDLILNYKNVGHKEKARKLSDDYLRMLEIQVDNLTKTHGPAHVNTLEARQWLASAHYTVGQKEKALVLREAILEDCRDHQFNLTKGAARWYLADSYQYAGRVEEAAELIEKNVGQLRELDGEDGLNTLANMNRLAGLYAQLGRRDDAIRLEENGLKLMRRKAVEHNLIRRMRDQLAALYTQTGRLEEAIALREEILEEVRKKRLATVDEKMRAAKALADLYAKDGRTAESEKLNAEAVKFQLEGFKETERLPPEAVKE